MAWRERKVSFCQPRYSSETIEFKEVTQQDAEIQLIQEFTNLLNTIDNSGEKEYYEKQFKSFQSHFKKYMDGLCMAVNWDNVAPLIRDFLLDYKNLMEPQRPQMKDMLNKVVVVKLNGGLGSSMGCIGPKSLITIRNDLTFLDLVVQQIEHLNRTYDVDVPLVLMNSFSTEVEIEKVVRKYRGLRINIHMFTQSRHPRIDKETLMPIATTLAHFEVDKWYPPGHGDFYEAFYNSGLPEVFLYQGKEYCFVSNVDNLGATVDGRILNYLLETSNNTVEFVMEVTDKTKADAKGGNLVQYRGRPRLLEFSQIPEDHIDDFKKSQKFSAFNTNNLWIKLRAMNRVIEENRLDLDIIYQQKTINSDLNIIQLETVAGSAIKDFETTVAIRVPRSRFLPVKTTSDLFLLMSSLYMWRNGNLIMSPWRPYSNVPLIKLEEKHFGKVSDFFKRFPTIPNIWALDQLTICGDVTFGKNVTLKGMVIIIANCGEKIDIPPGTILDDKIVSGNLRILDH